MNQDESGSPDPERWAQDFSWMHEGRRLGARRHKGVHEVVVLRVQENDPEVFLVVVGSPEEIASEKGDGFR
jgi:hypothetical protein